MAGNTDWAYFDRPATAVEDNLAVMNGRADDAIDRATDAIAELSDIDFGPLPAAPNLVLPDIDVKPQKDVPEPANFNSLGTVSSIAIPSFDDLWATLGFTLADVDIDIDPFESTVGAIVMPTPPAPIDTSGLPVAPVPGTITIPVAPDPFLPTLDDLTELVIPDFTFPTLPTFDDVAPEFTAVAPSTILGFSEPAYASEVLDDVKARIRAMAAGGTGIPAAVQLALFDRARMREDLTSRAAVQDAFDTFASRNYSMPPGMLVAQVNAALEKNQFQSNSLQRDILIKSTDAEIANLRFAVEQGIAYETLLHNYVNNVAQRSFEAAKTRVEADISLYNAEATVFNSRNQGYQVAAQVFKIRIDAALAELEVFKAEIQAEIAKGQLNEQKVRAYEARLRAVMSVIEIYKAKMDGARVQSDVEKNRIEGYRASIEAYAARLGADKTRFDAYEANVRGEGQKAVALEAEARAYAATVQAQEAKSNVKLKYIDARISTIRAGLEKFTATLAAERETVQAQLAQIQARAAAFSADVGRYTAEIEGVTKTQQTELLVSEARLRNNLARFDAVLREYDASMDRMLKQAALQVEGLKAAGQITSTLAAGAMAAIHVQASMSGSGSLSATNSYNVNHNFTDS